MSNIAPVDEGGKAEFEGLTRAFTNIQRDEQNERYELEAQLFNVLLYQNNLAGKKILSAIDMKKRDALLAVL